MFKYLRKAVFLLFSLLCFCMLASVVLFVLVHGIEQGEWELRYIADMLLASVICAGLRKIYKERNRNAPAEKAEERRSGVRKTAILIAVVCFAVHVTVIQLIRLQPIGDAGVFFRAAQDLAKDTQLRYTDLLALFPHILGYSNFLSVFFRLFQREDVAPYVNAVLSTASTLLLFLIVWLGSGRNKTGEENAVYAALAWGLLPSVVFYDCLVLSEPLYTAMILLFVLMIEKIADAGKNREKWLPALTFGMLGGLLLSAIHAVRTVSAILLIALLIWLLLQEEVLKSSRRSRIAVCFFFVLLFVYTAGNRAWTGVLTAELGEEPASAPWYNMLTGFNEEVSGTHSEVDAQILYAAKREAGATARSAQEKMLELLKERLRSGINFPRLYAEKMKLFAGNDETVVSLIAPALCSGMEAGLIHLCNVAYYILLIQTFNPELPA